VAIIPVQPPKAAQPALAAALQSRHRHLFNGGHDQLSITALLPRYLLPLRQEPVRRNLLLVGWDAFVISEDDVALASLRATEGSLAFSGLTFGRLARAALVAAALGQDRLGSKSAVFRPCFIESSVAGLLSIAFLTRRGASRHVPLVDGGAISPDALQLRKGVSHLLARMHARSAQDVRAEAFDFAR